MEASMMVMPYRRQHPVCDMPVTGVVAPEMDLGFQNTGFHYNLNQGNTMGFDNFTYFDYQPLALLPPLFSHQPAPLSTQCARYPPSRVCEPLHVKLEDSPFTEAFAGLPSGDGILGINDDTTFGTDVDILMRTIQTKTQTKAKSRIQEDYSPQESICASYGEEISSPIPAQGEIRSRNSSPWNGTEARKTYQCDLPTCAKLFYQKTHLEIHMRAHTGYKPFVRAP